MPLGEAVVGNAVGKHPIELGVAFLDAGFHAAAQPGIAALEAVDQRLGAQPGPAVAEVFEPQCLQGHAVGFAFEGERLHNPAWAHVVEAAAEAELLTVADGHKPETATVTRVPLVDARLHPVRADPLPE